VLAAAFPGLFRFMTPRAGAAGQDRLEMGALQNYIAPSVTTRWLSRHGVWLVNLDGRLFALEARCTHLGCTPRWIATRGVFRCPCHGSRFARDGDVLRGPATEALHRYGIRVEHQQVIVDRTLKATRDEAEWDARFFITV